MNVLVQGAAGFVGRTLVPYLVHSRLPNLTLVDPQAVPANILRGAELDGARISFYQTDTLHEFVDKQIDIIISLSGQTDVDAALQTPKAAFDSNINIAVQLGEFLRLHRRAPRLIYLSSDEVLGESFSPLHENAPLRPTQPYAASKAAAEIILHTYRDVYKLHIVTLRSCNLVGPLQRARKLIPVAVKAICSSSAVPVFGDGHHLREWMAVEDLCAAIVHLVWVSATPQVFQASSSVSISVNEVINIVASALGQEPRMHTVRDRLVHDQSYAMQTSRLRSLGWKPSIDPRQAIKSAARALALPHVLDELQNL